MIVGSTQSVSAPSPQVVAGATHDLQGLVRRRARRATTSPPRRARSPYTAYYELPECTDGVDNDADGDVDHPADPGCTGPLGKLEGSACDNDRDDDGDGKVDWDGGPLGGAPDPQCAGNATRDSERPGCGLGFELVLALPLLAAGRRARRARR